MYTWKTHHCRASHYLNDHVLPPHKLIFENSCMEVAELHAVRPGSKNLYSAKIWECMPVCYIISIFHTIKLKLKNCGWMQTSPAIPNLRSLSAPYARTTCYAQSGSSALKNVSTTHDSRQQRNKLKWQYKVQSSLKCYMRPTSVISSREYIVKGNEHLLYHVSKVEPACSRMQLQMCAHAHCQIHVNMRYTQNTRSDPTQNSEYAGSNQNIKKEWPRWRKRTTSYNLRSSSSETSVPSVTFPI